MDTERTVSVGEEEASVVEECKVGGKCMSRRDGLSLKPDRWVHLALSVTPLSIGAYFPYRFPLGELGESFHVLVSASVKFLVSFPPYFQSVSASLELFAEGTDEFAIEDENGRVIGLVATAFVNGVKVARLVHGGVVWFASALLGKLGPVMMNFVAVVAFTDYECSRLALLGR